ncbi:MAG: VWA domain-containing protein, partial [Verrucomicrobia bacterium]|nr:VWA domain-containing protein [Verrucomicrobiota bacterium]
MSDYADLVMHHIQKRRIEFATAAALFSVLLHVAILVWLVLGPIEIPFWHAIPDASPPRDIPMQVQNVAREPAQPLVRDAEPGSSAGAQGPATLDANSVERLEIPLDRVDVEPPPTDGNALAPSAVLQELSLPPNAEPWQPRHTIMEVERTAVRDELAARERRRIPRLERVIDAPDVVYPAKPAAATIAAVPPGADAGLAKPNLATMLRRVTSAAPARQDAIPIPDPIARSGSGVLAESAADVTDMQPIESLLSARITTFTHRRDPEYGYFRVDITRRTAEVLPVLAKDILFIQDCSASMSEQRLYFCRQGLINSLPLIGPEDRFNIVAFRDQVESCFEGWMTNSVAARTRAEQFVQGLESRGETDLFTAIRAALGFTVEPGRPVIVILVSDGHATTGLRGGAAIIREFTQANRGAIS